MEAKLKGQYIVYRTGKDGTRFDWGLVKGESATEVTGVSEKGVPYDEQQPFDIRRKDVVAALGFRPNFGTAYGCRIEPFLRTVESEAWGSLHFFTKLSPEDKEKLKVGLTTVMKKLRHHGLQGFLPIDIEIRVTKGKYAGMYKHFGSPEKQDRMILHPSDWSSSAYVVAHEAAHGVWFNLLTAKQRAKWIELYHAYLTVAECDSETVKALRNDFCGQTEEHVRDFKGQLEEDEALVFELCIEHITSYHGLSIVNIDSLIDAESGDVLKKMWPTSKVLKTDWEYPISEYAAKSVEEFFAEALSFHLTGKQIPKKVRALLDATVQRCAGRKSFKFKGKQ